MSYITLGKYHSVIITEFSKYCFDITTSVGVYLPQLNLHLSILMILYSVALDER